MGELVNLRNEIEHDAVEGIGFFKIDWMSGARNDPEPGIRDRPLHEESRLQAWLIIITAYDQSRYHHALQLGLELINRGSLHLVAARCERRTHCGMFGKLPIELVEAAWVFFLLATANGDIGVVDNDFLKAKSNKPIRKFVTVTQELVALVRIRAVAGTGHNQGACHFRVR